MTTHPLLATFQPAQFRRVLEWLVCQEASQVFGHVLGTLVALSLIRRETFAGDALQAPRHIGSLLPD